ncbi:patatin-like phospholipase family protein [Rhodoferax sp.]|uniref:patatin-like phospholipase family protein n=1 Tax=Rhodoferax sp. TaxID=50421 RepID=UPI0025CF310C|nr:patatin-like phospholipase family protein [Rhodoferax sp.]
MTDAKRSATTPPIVNLALQGGGSHGAFTWGVLDALLEDGRLDFEGISGTSAGAMNAVALAHGFAQAEGAPPAAARDSARQSLADFWEGVVSMGALSNTLAGAHKVPFDLLFGGLSALTGSASPSQILSDAVTSFWTQAVSPYQSNPLDINPLRTFLERQIDFERLAAYQPLKVFVVATQVRSGKAEIFSGKRLTADAVMASACLPTVFQAVEIEGEHYWDGGYAGNPAIHPLIYECTSPDVLLVQINPIHRNALPTTAAGILDRLNEITFNSALMAEMRAIDFVKRLLVEGKLDPARYKNVLMHRIDGGGALEEYPASSKSDTDSKLIHTLRDLGRTCAKRWLRKHIASIGVECSINIAADYLDDLRVPPAA